MGEITESVPKPLVNLHEQSILDLKMQAYKAKGFKKFVFCIGYKGEMIREAASKYEDIDCRFSDAGEEAGIFKRLYKARNLFEGPIVMSYGDTFADLDFNELLARHAASRCLATIVTASIQNPFGLVTFDQDNRVSSFAEKPVHNYYIGYAVFSPEALDTIPEQARNLKDGQGLVLAFNTLLSAGSLNAFNFSGLQLTVNTKEDLSSAREIAIKYFTMPDISPYET